MSNVDLELVGAATAAEGVSQVVIEKTAPKFLSKVGAKVAGMPLPVKVGAVVLTAAGAGYLAYKFVCKPLYNKFFKKNEEVVEEQPTEETTEATTEEAK